MVELGELEKRHEEFAKRHIRVVAISNDDQSTAQETQADFPHLVMVSDAEQKMARAMQVIQPGAGPHHDDTNAPTTFIVDGTGKVRWLFRPERFISRLDPDDLLAAIDETGPYGSAAR
jgi:alkyl hydroperoxide reductase subunit AhpC